MAEREEDLLLLPVVEPVSDEYSLRIFRFPFPARIRGECRSVFPCPEERDGEFSRGVDVSEEHVGKGVPLFLASEPGLDDPGDPVDPRHQYRRPRGNHHDGAGVRLCDRFHEFVLPHGKCNGCPVDPFRLDLTRIPHADYCQVGFPRQIHRCGQEVAVQREPSELDERTPLALIVFELHGNFFSFFEPDPLSYCEPRVVPPVVDEEIAVDVQPGSVVTPYAQLKIPGLRRDDRSRPAD